MVNNFRNYVLSMSAETESSKPDYIPISWVVLNCDGSDFKWIYSSIPVIGKGVIPLGENNGVRAKSPTVRIVRSSPEAIWFH